MIPRASPTGGIETLNCLEISVPSSGPGRTLSSSSRALHLPIFQRHSVYYFSSSFEDLLKCCFLGEIFCDSKRSWAATLFLWFGFLYFCFVFLLYNFFFLLEYKSMHNCSWVASHAASCHLHLESIAPRTVCSRACLWRSHWPLLPTRTFMLNRLRHFSHCDEQNTWNVQTSSESLSTYLWGNTQGEEGMSWTHPCSQSSQRPSLGCVSDAQARAESGEPGLTYKDPWAPLLTPGWIHPQQDPWLRVQPTLRSPAVQRPLSWKDGYYGDTVSFGFIS